MLCMLNGCNCDYLEAFYLLLGKICIQYLSQIHTLECLIAVHVRLFFLQIYGCMYGLIRHCMSIYTRITEFITYKKPKIITVFIIILSDLYVKYALLRHVRLKIL